MASISVTISDPVLGVGESFRERHRLLPAGAWSGYTSRTNATFSITGLTEGRYELEISFVQADGTICPAVSRYYDVVEPPEEEPYECPDFTVTQVLNPNRIKIEYTGGVGVPPCGYKIEYRVGTGAYQPTNYATLPASPFYINLPFGGSTIHVRITANQCNGSIVCYEDDVTAPPAPVCEHMTGFDYIVTPLEQPMQKRKAYTITLTATTQSTPTPTTAATFTITQGFAVSPAVPWVGTFPVTGLSPTAFSVTFTVYHNFPFGSPTPPVYWVLTFNDACGYLHNINVDYP